LPPPWVARRIAPIRRSKRRHSFPAKRRPISRPTTSKWTFSGVRQRLILPRSAEVRWAFLTYDVQIVCGAGPCPGPCPAPGAPPGPSRISYIHGSSKNHIPFRMNSFASPNRSSPNAVIQTRVRRSIPKSCLPKRKSPPTEPTRNIPAAPKQRRVKPPPPAITLATASAPTTPFFSSSRSKALKPTVSCALPSYTSIAPKPTRASPRN
jgi:hypothetical protein